MPEGRYKSPDIEVLPGVEAVRRRPQMYVGDPTQPTALALVTLEPLCLAVDEKTGGPARSVVVTLLDGDIAEVSNDGPGLPLGGRAGSSESYIELIMTKLHACRDDKAEEANRRWCGAGVAVLCALAEWCSVTVRREGSIWVQRFERGSAAGRIERQGDSSHSGTALRFKPDRGILTGAFDAGLIAKKLKEFALEVPCVATELRDQRLQR